VKLLFDQNLSRSLVALFPASSHVTLVGLQNASDPAIHAWAAEHGYAIVTKDDDFNDLAQRLGAPPKVIFLSLGNGPTAEVAAALQLHAQTIAAFLADPGSPPLLEIYRHPEASRD
jgi:predicted nuclease of predicted toxin-antitoxin system